MATSEATRKPERSLNDARFTRQLDLIDPAKCALWPVTIIGAGAVGSWIALALAKMGFTSITVWDHDKVDDVNLNCQFYPEDSVGEFKAKVLADMVKRFTGVVLTARCQRWEGEIITSGLIITAVDNMATRQAIFETHRGRSLATVIDPRMAAEYCTIFTYKPMSQHEHYRKLLFDDVDAVQERCTAKATIYTANLIAGLVCKTAKDIVNGAAYVKSLQYDIGTNQMISFKWEEV